MAETRIVLRRSCRSAPADDSVIVVGLALAEMQRGGARVSLPRPALRAMLALLARSGGLVTRDELVEAIWGERADGGPLTAAGGALNSVMEAARAAGAALGIVITTEHGRGYRARTRPRAA